MVTGKIQVTRFERLENVDKLIKFKELKKFKVEWVEKFKEVELRKQVVKFAI